MVLQQMSQHSQHQSTARTRIPSGPLGLAEQGLLFDGISFFFFRFLYFERTRPTAQVRGNLASGRVLTSSKPLGTLGME